jgi:hypothetical protein
MGPDSPTPIGLSSKWVAPPMRDGIDMSAAVPPFRERAPWLGGDLQTLRNTVRGAPADLPGGERLLLPMGPPTATGWRLDSTGRPAP